MKKQLLTCALLLASTIAAPTLKAQEKYFTAPTKDAVSTDSDGFIRRWTVLEPISKPNRSNTVFTDTYLREVFGKEYFKGQMTMLPKDGQKVKAQSEIQPAPKPVTPPAGGAAPGAGAPPMDFRRMQAPEPPKKVTETLKWHKIDSKTYNLKLLRFGEHQTKRLYGVIYWAVTVINCEEEMQDVRLSVGSNSASMWWVNGEEALILSGDRRMVADDAMSNRITLKQGENVIRGAIINGPGMSDFCVRFVNEQGEPITKGITIK